MQYEIWESAEGKLFCGPPQGDNSKRVEAGLVRVHTLDCENDDEAEVRLKEWARENRNIQFPYTLRTHHE